MQRLNFVCVEKADSEHSTNRQTIQRTDRKFNEPTESRTDRFSKGLRTDRFPKRTNRFSGEPSGTAVGLNRTGQYRNELASTAIQPYRYSGWQPIFRLPTDTTVGWKIWVATRLGDVRA